MLKIGLTGGIGSGKSMVAKIFEVLGIPVYYADDAARSLMNEDQELRVLIQKQFGEAAYTDNELDRAYISEKVFGDPFQLELLNSIVHPATLRDAANWMQSQQAPYAIKEAALIFESGSAAQLDYVIGVFAPLALRIKRTMERSGMEHAAVVDRMNNQIDEEIKMKLCDFVLQNDEQRLLVPQVVELHQKLLDISRQTGNAIGVRQQIS